jgi:hypothetical protein
VSVHTEEEEVWAAGRMESRLGQGGCTPSSPLATLFPLYFPSLCDSREGFSEPSKLPLSRSACPT